MNGDSSIYYLAFIIEWPNIEFLKNETYSIYKNRIIEGW
jgi:hypothetical protein